MFSVFYKISIYKLLPKELFTFSKRQMCSDNKQPFTILVEGNIGCGKTTFLNNFKNHGNICTEFEPVERWKNLEGHDLMTLFYENASDWAFSFQSYVLLTMMQVHRKKTDKPIKMIERSIYSGRYVFIENLAHLNVLSKPEFTILDKWFNWLIKNYVFSVDLIIYLRTDPEVAFQRIQQRSRVGENKLTLDYLRKVHQYHEDWLFGKNSIFCPAPVWCLNANKDVETIKQEYMCLERKMQL